MFRFTIRDVLWLMVVARRAVFAARCAGRDAGFLGDRISGLEWVIG
jgi:hypothetical protein